VDQTNFVKHIYNIAILLFYKYTLAEINGLAPAQFSLGRWLGHRVWMGVGVRGFSRRVRRHFLLNLKAAAAVLTAPVEVFLFEINGQSYMSKSTFILVTGGIFFNLTLDTQT
jgi:hypothetical protein